jgi:hypothetical protein
MVLLNLYSLSHFILWSTAGRFVLTSWKIFIILSIGWELLELILPFEFAVEGWENKCMDIVINTLGFSIGCRMRYHANVGQISKTISQNQPGP